MYNFRKNTFLKQIVYHICFLFIFLSINEGINAQELAKNDRVVILDAGHGGKDSGARGSKSLEKDIALAISLKVGKYVNENLSHVKVVYTRKKDVFVPLHKRAQIANDNKADLFISIHVNANPKPTPYGTSSHVLGLHRANENFEVAKRENSVILLEEDYSTRYEDFDPNVPESYIMFNLMQNIYLEQSIYLGQLVQNQFRERAQRKDRGVKQQGLLVLAQISMPGILVETGFITNSTEEKYLMSEQGQDYISSAIYRAIKNYLNKINEIDQAGSEINKDTLPNNQISQDTSTVSVIDTNRVIFKIQVSSSSKKIPIDSVYFNNLKPVGEYFSDGFYKYTIGEENSFKEIKKVKKEVKNHFPDAFIIAFKKGEKIPVNEAIKESKN
jgi:N-acetylmuramoyl-L-alanine amidase